MGKNKYFSFDLKKKVVELYRAERKQKEISENLNIPKGTISEIIKKFQARGSVATAQKSGRPKKLSTKAEKTMKRISVADPRKSSREISQEMAELGFAVSARTVRRRLNAQGLYGRVAVKKPLI